VSRLKEPVPVAPIFAIFSSDVALIESAIEEIEKKWAPILKKSALFDFNQTKYYEKEMGANLKKIFVVLERFISPNFLINLKYWAYEFEFHHLEDRKRKINIDPGLLSSERLVLATGKNYVHRIYLGKGVWVDLTLIFKKGSFRTLPWTYPDYATDFSIDFWNNARLSYLNVLRFGLKGQGVVEFIPGLWPSF